MKYLSTLCAAVIIGGVAIPSMAQMESTENNVKYVPSGVKRLLWHVSNLNPDCSVNPGSMIKIEQQPSNGKVEITPGEGYAWFAPDNPRHVCNNKKVAGLNISYQSNPKFTGEDQFSLLLLMPDGRARPVNYKINVIGSETKSEAPKQPANPAVAAVAAIDPKLLEPVDPFALKPFEPAPFEPPKIITSPEVKLPPNGIMHAKKDRSAVAPFNVNTPPGSHYIIKLVNEDTKKREITFFIRAASHFEGKVPFGKYRIVGVYGPTWQGEKDYFGDESVAPLVRDSTLLAC
jgi:hypothetical protein